MTAGLLSSTIPLHDAEEPKWLKDFAQFSRSQAVRKAWHFSSDRVAEGCDGIVLAGMGKGGEGPVVAKVFKRSDQAKVQFKAEVHFLRALRHPNVVQILEVLHDPPLVHAFVMPRYWGDVVKASGAIGGFKGEATRCLSLGLLEALTYLHSKHVAHRDVKPDNVLIAADWDPSKQPERFGVVLADFGRAVEATSPLSGTCGTWIYSAPEVRAGTEYGVECDLWSAAMSLVGAFSDYEPDMDAWEEASTKAGGVQKELESLSLSLPQKVREVLQGLFAYKPSERLIAAQACEKLRADTRDQINFLRIDAEEILSLESRKDNNVKEFLQAFLAEATVMASERSFNRFWEDFFARYMTNLRNCGKSVRMNETCLRRGAVEAIGSLREGMPIRVAVKVGLAASNSVHVFMNSLRGCVSGPRKRHHAEDPEQSKLGL